MNAEQITIMAILVGMIGLFIWAPWRHDFVAIAALLACVLTGLVPAADAFTGFGHSLLNKYMRLYNVNFFFFFFNKHTLTSS